MVLCSACTSTLHIRDSTLPQDSLDVSARTALDHHPTVESFRDAVDGGCYICCWFEKEHDILTGKISTHQYQPFTIVRINARLNVFRQELSFSIGLNSIGDTQWVQRGPQSTFDLLQLVRMEHASEARSRRTIDKDQVFPDGNSPQADKGIARQWLQRCLGSHSLCRAPADQEHFVPTRLIDALCRPERRDGRYWRLIETKGRTEIKSYVTLSHCWGLAKNIRLEESNAVQFKAEQPDSRLPPKYRDALSLVRSLGLQYIWIDSLCIKQDSEEDWLREGLQMHRIYARSTLTIAACRAKDSNEHFLPRRQDQKPLLEVVKLDWFSENIYGDTLPSEREKSLSPANDITQSSSESSGALSDSVQLSSRGSSDIVQHPAESLPQAQELIQRFEIRVDDGTEFQNGDSRTRVSAWQGDIWANDSDDDPDFVDNGSETGSISAPTIPWSSKDTEYLIYHENFFRSTLSRSLLAVRAWCYQELVLSPRILHCMQDQFFWECRSLKSCEAHPFVTIGSEFDKSQPLPADLFRHAIGAEPSSASSLQPSQPPSRWHSVVQGYTRGLLTNSGDKLIAMAGIAKAFQLSSGLSYAAGLWKEEMPYCLLWRVEGSEIIRGESVHCVNRPLPYRAPSWSWCSVDGLIIYDTIWIGTIVELVIIREVHVSSANDPLGKVTSGSIELEGIIIEARRTCPPSEALLHSTPDDVAHDFYTLEAADTIPMDEICYLPLVYVPSYASLDDDESRISGLLLVRAPPGNVSGRAEAYSRVGMFNLQRKLLPAIGIHGGVPEKNISDWLERNDMRETLIIV